MTVGRAIGRVEVPHLTAVDPTGSYLFSSLERLSFYREDLLFAFIIAPVAFLVFVRILPARWRLLLTVGAAIGVVVFLQLQMRGYWTVGRFQSWRLWWDAIRWGANNPEDAEAYAGDSLLLKLAVAGVVVAGTGALLQRLYRQYSTRPDLLWRLATGLHGLVVSVTALAWLSPLDRSPYHRSALSITAQAFVGFDGSAASTALGTLSGEELLEMWRKLTNSPPKDPSGPFFGAAKGLDVVAFVLETAPARCVSFAEPVDWLPYMNELRKGAWVGLNHFTTYPLTTRALFSIFSSWYPTDAEYFQYGRPKVAPGLVRSLERIGYTAAAYLPSAISSEDEQFHRAVGLSRLVYGDALIPAGEASNGVDSARRKVKLDRAALNALMLDTARWVAADKRYFAVFLPQIGHAPWPDLSTGGVEGDNLGRCRAIIAVQDSWLGELLQHLHKLGRGDKTILLVTADHGIRTRMEDPSLEGGLLDPYSFHVPLLIYAPHVLSETVPIPWVTSHIDIGPSLLDLVGAESGRMHELGLPVWDNGIDRRTTFLWAKEYLGADGYHRDGRFSMLRYMSGAISSSLSFDFVREAESVPGDLQGERVRRTLAEARGLQQSIGRLASPER